jgi:uncharacterized membrane protein YidH (DUF202 family)
MKPYVIVAALLITVGVLALAYQGLTYKTAETAIDIGPLKVTTEQTHTIPLPPVLGATAIVGGILLLVLGRRKA